MPPKKRFKFQSKKPSKTSTGASVDVLNVEIIQVGSWSIRQKNGFAELDLPNRHNAEMVLSIRQNLQNCYLLCSKLCSALSL